MNTPTVLPLPAAPSAAFPGSHIPAPESYEVVSKEFFCSEVDDDYIRKSADQPDADQLVASHHRARFDADTNGLIHGIQMVYQRIADQVAVGMTECARLKANLESVGPEYFHLHAGNQLRTFQTWAEVACFVLVALGVIPLDYLVFRHLTEITAPDLVNSWTFMTPLVGLSVLAITAFKASLTLGAPNEASHWERCRRWSQILMWAAVPLFIAIAWRCVDMSADPLASLLADTNAGPNWAALSVYFLQIAAQTLAATGLFLAASHKLWLTRPAKHPINPAYAVAEAAWKAGTKLLDENRNRLGLAQQRLAAIAAERDLLLHRAAGALLEERRRIRADQLEIQNLRRS